MTTIEELQTHLDAIEETLGYHFKDKKLLTLAFTHRSYVNENKQVISHNERLEFLGDSILGLLIADFLYNKMPETSEGDLSFLRSRLVEASSCMHYVTGLNLHSYILLGRGERMNDGRGRESILADLFEALIGAIYLDGGIEAAREFLFSKCAEKINHILKTPLSNWKAVLQDHCQKNFQKTPEYTLLSESGPDHSKIFVIAVELNGETLGEGTGPSKKEAQQAAAQNAIEKLGLNKLG